jgi:Pilus assembly protein, PilO.
MQKLAVRSNVVLASIKPDKINSQADYDELAVAVEATGNYFQLLAFLKAVENMPRFVRVRQMLIQAEEKQLRGRFLLVVYAKKEKAMGNL